MVDLYDIGKGIGYKKLTLTVIFLSLALIASLSYSLFTKSDIIEKNKINNIDNKKIREQIKLLKNLSNKEKEYLKRHLKNHCIEYLYSNLILDILLVKKILEPLQNGYENNFLCLSDWALLYLSGHPKILN